MATEYAVYLGKRQENEICLSMQWFYSFMDRWPELRVVKPSSLSELRARCASEMSIRSYFKELESILDKYLLKDKPHLIYNIDEKGINTEFKPPNVVAGCGYQPQAVMSKKSKTITVIGAGNALGNQIPPYFVFPGQRMMPELFKGKTVGADGTMTPTGWSNSEVFRSYMKNHFLKYVQGRDPSETILALYDGHRSHISLDLIEWAKNNNIVLFVLPPHCSHILQPLDVGCFGPFQLKYNQTCLSFSRLNHKTVTRYDVCAFACRAYTAVLSPSNIQSAFSKSGIYPFQSADHMVEILKQKITPSVLYNNETGDQLGCDRQSDGNHEPKAEESGIQTHDPSITQKNTEKQTDCTGDHHPIDDQDVEFFTRKGGEVQKKIEIVKKKRRNISHEIGGKDVTEEETLEKMKDYLSKSAKQIKKPNNVFSTSKKAVKKSQKNKRKNTKDKKAELEKSQQPGPSTLKQPGPSAYCTPCMIDSSEDENEDEISENEKCCVCKNFFVKSRNVYEIAIVKWAECESCGHWVHLQYCTSVRVVRQNTSFKCPCCE